MRTTTVMTSAPDTAFYVCECGFEKHIVGGENARHGLDMVQRLHKKVCKMAMRNGTQTVRSSANAGTRHHANENTKENMEFVAKARARAQGTE